MLTVCLDANLSMDDGGNIRSPGTDGVPDYVVKKTAKAKDLASAAAIVRKYIEKNELGASNLMPNFGIVKDESGKKTARISYNGRIWDPSGKQEIRAALAAVRAARVVLSISNETWGDVGAGREFLVDGERVSFEDLWLANADDEDFIEGIVALRKGQEMTWGGGAAADFEIRRVK